MPLSCVFKDFLIGNTQGCWGVEQSRVGDEVDIQEVLLDNIGEEEVAAEETGGERSG